MRGRTKGNQISWSSSTCCRSSVAAKSVNVKSQSKRLDLTPPPRVVYRSTKGSSRFTPPFHLLKHSRLHFEAFFFRPTVDLQLYQRVVDRAKWFSGLKSVFDACLDCCSNPTLVHDFCFFLPEVARVRSTTATLPIPRSIWIVDILFICRAQHSLIAATSAVSARLQCFAHKGCFRDRSWTCWSV